MKKLLIVMLVMLTLAGCSETKPAEENEEEKTPEEEVIDDHSSEVVTEEVTVVGQIAEIDTDKKLLYLNPSIANKDFGHALEYTDGMLDGYAEGDEVTVKCAVADRTASLLSIDHSNVLYQKEEKLSEVIPFTPDKVVMLYEGWVDGEGIKDVETVIEDSKVIEEIMNQLKEISVYADGVMVRDIGGGVTFVFSEGNNEVKITEAGVLTVEAGGNTSYYAYKDHMSHELENLKNKVTGE